MIKIKYKKSLEGGFSALVAVMLISFGVMAITISTLSSAILYMDGVRTKELRIQTRLNTKACIDSAQLISIKDYFFTGTTSIRDFGCEVKINNDLAGHIKLLATSTLERVKFSDEKQFLLTP